MTHKMSFNFLINRREWELKIVNDKEEIKLYFTESEFIILIRDLMLYYSVCVLNKENEVEILLKDMFIRTSVDKLKILIDDMINLKRELDLLVMSN